MLRDKIFHPAIGAIAVINNYTDGTPTRQPANNLQI
jgi:hypothetical protein